MVLKRKHTGITFGYCDVESGQRIYPVPPPSEMTDILPEQQPPSRLPAFKPDSTVGDAQNIRLTCSPPLAQATVIRARQSDVRVLVCIESEDQVLSGSAPEVVLWHNHNGEHEWNDLELQPASSSAILFGRSEKQSSSTLWYEAKLSGLPKHGHAVSFTLKVRLQQGHDWTWVKDAFGLEDGTLCYQTEDLRRHAEHDARSFFSGFSSDIQIHTERPDTAATQLYSLSVPVPAAEGLTSGYSHHRLGVPKRLKKWFAEVRLWGPWIAPRHGEKHINLDKDAILLSFLRSDGLHVAVLAISGVNDILAIFESDDAGNVIIKARNERAEAGSAIVLVAVAESFDIANAAVFYHSRKIVSDNAAAELDKEIKVLQDEHVKPEWLEEWYDGFTYCTWNALGQDLSAQKIYDALDDLAKENIIIRNLIIDDNWQSLSGEQGVDNQMDRGWMAFEANKKGFPDGMKATTSEIRKRHPNIKHIAVWHAILGYWGGISPDGWIAKNYKTITVPKNDGSVTVVDAKDVGRLYDDFYRFLADSGVDAVKTDAQFMLDDIHNAPDRRALIAEYQDAWMIAHLRHLGSRAISCMSQTPQLMFHSQLPTNKPRILVRNSDDFFPDIDSSHPWHVFCNAHNSIITQHLNVLPDWDMFQTSHKWASFHAAARCVSGGPIYFTDYPGHHNIELIRQITAQTTRNTTIILRPHTIGRTITPYNDYKSQAALKVGTYVGHAQTGTGILGVFNVSKRPLREFLQLSDFPGTDTGEYIVHSFVSSQVSDPITRNHAQHKIGLELPTTGWDILSAHAIRTFQLKGDVVQVALFGLLGKMTGSAAITGSVIEVEKNGRLRIWSSYKAVGVVGIYLSTLPQRTISDDVMVGLYGRPIPEHCVKINSACDKLLEIDIEKAWKENKEEPGWSNEVSIELFIQ